MKNVIALSLTLISLSSGCGYQFSGSGSILPEDVKTVAVLPVENRTTESAVGTKLLDALQSRFERYGVVSVVESPEEADAVLIAKVRSVDSKVRNVSGETDFAVDLSLTLVVSAELKRRNGQILYRDENVSASESFAGQSDVVVTSSSEFIQGGIGSDTLAGLGANEVSRGQRSEVLETLIDEVSRKVYNDAVAADF